MANKIIFDNGFEHEFSDDEMKLLRFAVNRLHPYAETCFRYDEIESLDDTADNLRSLFLGNISEQR